MEFLAAKIPKKLRDQHAADGGKDLACWQADLGGSAFLSVLVGFEPVGENDEMLFHASVTVNYKRTNGWLRFPTRIEIDSAIAFLAKPWVWEIERRGGCVHLWQPQTELKKNA